MKRMLVLVIIILALVSYSAKISEDIVEKCGDGTCDIVEQQDATLCPADCNGERQETAVTPQTQTQMTTEDTSSYPPDEFTFIPDEGIRMLDASNPGVRANDDGSISLLYEDRSSNTIDSKNKKTPSAQQYIATSNKGLIFDDRGEGVTGKEGGQFRAKQLPDGTWRGYGYDTTKGIEGGCLTSQSSSDGVTYTDDEGCRYTLQEEDQGWMGVYDFFADSKNNIVLLYLGDKYGLNNVRRAYSTDGWTFTFTNGNVLGDEDLGGMSYVDEKVLVLPDHRVFLVAMQQGTIYGFISEDDGVSFQRYKEVLLEPSDFTSEQYGTVSSLHDPQIAQLDDGRLRIYVAALFNGDEATTDDVWGIVSATTYSHSIST